MSDPRDVALMDRALFVAERGRGRTSPNPIVGAVVVSTDGTVIAQGAHLVAGGPHAEVVALDLAGERARGATLYCTLEPCSHTGRTGPCVDRIMAAGISRVIVAVEDPNPLVSGRGLEKLRSAGLDVVTGIGREAALHQHAPFFRWVTSRRPFVIAKTATSADGFVGRPGERVLLTEAEANRHFHRQRAEVDAIAVGSGTVLTDDPELTPRGAYRYRPLTRVVFDWSGRVPETARLFSTLPAGPVIIVVLAMTAEARRAEFDGLRSRGIEILPVPERSLKAVLEALAVRGIVSLLVEGGPALQSAFAADGLVDRWQWVRTTALLGHGIRVAPEVLAAAAIARPQERPLGRDTLLEWDVHRID